MAERARETGENLAALQDRWDIVVRFAYGDELVGAASWTDACQAIVPGYEQLADDDLTGQFAARLLYASRLQVQYQAFLNSHFDLSGVGEADLAVLTGARTDQPDITVWMCPVPLVLVDGADYEPHGPKLRPVGIPEGDPSGHGGNLLWLDASSEAALLRSMEHAQIVDLFVAGVDPHRHQ